MHHGRQWISLGAAHLAEAWTEAKNDEIRGMDETSGTFWRAVMEAFSILNPRHADNYGRCKARLGVDDAGGFPWNAITI